MITHDQVFDHFHAEIAGVSLVSRYADPALGLPEGGADVFLPDCHILSAADAAQYPRSCFRQGQALEAFLFSLLRLKQAQAAAGNEVRVWHVGDVVDEWRSLQPGGPGPRIDGICAAFPTIFDLLTRSDGLDAEILAGNHDFQLHLLPQWNKARFRVVGTAQHGQMMVLHGDVFDWIESLPDPVQAFVVRLARSYASPTHPLSAQTQAEAVKAVNAKMVKADVPTGKPHPALGASPTAHPAGPGVAAQNVIDGDHVKTLFFEAALKLPKELNSQGFNIRLMVIGHTHFARIVRGAQGGGAPFVLMDCGAWVDKCVLPGEDKPVLCAQFAVRIGNELRVYQAGRAAG
jgi:UDP-2,3-diacylglucosamine pyrophosphatase LpxH